MPTPVSVQKSPARAPARISLSSTIPVKLLSLDAVFQEFVSIGRVLPDEKDRFCQYMVSLSAFVQKDILRLMTSRSPPFTRGEVNVLEADAVRLEKSLNNYLKNTAKSDYRSKTWYERYKTRIKLAIELLTPPPRPPPEA